MVSGRDCGRDGVTPPLPSAFLQALVFQYVTFFQHSKILKASELQVKILILKGKPRRDACGASFFDLHIQYSEPEVINRHLGSLLD